MHAQTPWRILPSVLFTLLPLHAQGAAQHPLDALDASEITSTTAILRSAGHADDKTLIASLTLLEPPKADVLACKAGDPKMREGLRKRGITDFEQLFCAPRTAGNFGVEAERTKRIVKVDCFDRRGVKSDVFANPIEGLFATVDLDRAEVIDVTDLGVVPVPRGNSELDPASTGVQRGIRPLVQTAPEGSNITLECSMVRWQKWSFHLRWELREGVVANMSRENATGYPVSYMIHPRGNALMLMDPGDPAASRAQFTNYHLWVTPYAPSERYAAGDYPNQSEPGQWLPAWTSRSRDIYNQDLVLWYTMGFHHVPSSEDWPVYNLGWHAVTLAPYSFFDRNPALDVPPVAKGGQ